MLVLHWENTVRTGLFEMMLGELPSERVKFVLANKHGKYCFDQLALLQNNEAGPLIIPAYQVVRVRV